MIPNNPQTDTPLYIVKLKEEVDRGGSETRPRDEMTDNVDLAEVYHFGEKHHLDETAYCTAARLIHTNIIQYTFLFIIGMNLIFVDFVDVQTLANHSQTEKSSKGFMLIIKSTKMIIHSSSFLLCNPNVTNVGNVLRRRKAKTSEGFLL